MNMKKISCRSQSIGRLYLRDKFLCWHCREILVSDVNDQRIAECFKSCWDRLIRKNPFRFNSEFRILQLWITSKNNFSPQNYFFINLTINFINTTRLYVVWLSVLLWFYSSFFKKYIIVFLHSNFTFGNLITLCIWYLNLCRRTDVTRCWNKELIHKHDM